MVDSCPNYKINSTGECIDTCPLSSYYYDFIEINEINLTEITMENYNKDNYLKYNTIPPKYLFNKICYDKCPLNSKSDDTNNKCICEYAFHLENEKTICYNFEYCINKTYKYYLNDTKQCISGIECPSGYYQFNFQCYTLGCPSESSQDSENSYKCISNHNFCYINEYFQNICGDISNDEYRYKFSNTKQYLKSCDESLVYTTYETKTYLYNNICHLSCPENTINNDTTNTCDCEYYKYYSDIDNYICYSKEEKCKDLIPVIDLKICLDSTNECKKKNYKIFNNECYSKECPINTQIIINDMNKCHCQYFYYNYTNNNTLNCFEENITCENKNYLYNNPEEYECYNSLEDCFSKENLFYFNKLCYKNKCPNGTIALSSTNKSIENYFIEELSLNNNLKDKICICDIINSNINWIMNGLNEIECLENCSDGYEPESFRGGKQCILDLRCMW